MIRILVVENDILLSSVTVGIVQEKLGAAAESAHTASQAMRLIKAARFDLALISVMKDSSGLSLAEYAADRDIPVLLASGDPFAQDKLQRFGYPYLPKPYPICRLVALATEAVAQSAENIRRVKASAATMAAHADAMIKALVIISETHHIVEIIDV